MPRPSTITDEQILEAARVVFVRDGVNATTREIAREAGIAEGSIFRRFPTKEALFRAAVLTPPTPTWVRELDQLAGQGELRENLIHIARELIRFVLEMLPLLRLAWGSGTGPATQTVEELRAREQPGARDRRLLAAYLRREMELGRLRSCDPEAVARMLFGACINYIQDGFVRNEPIRQEEAEAFCASLVDALWSGITPQDDRILTP